MNRPPRVRQLMDRLREQEFSREQVAAVWHKAVESAHDAELEAMSVDGALRAAALIKCDPELEVMLRTYQSG